MYFLLRFLTFRVEMIEQVPRLETDTQTTGCVSERDVKALTLAE